MGKRIMLLLSFLMIMSGAALYAAPEAAPEGVDATADTDGDGMPDWWEVKYFGQGGKFNKFNGKMDLDGDKVGALDEYKMGTNPNDKNIDKNGDGVADDWMKLYNQKDAAADTDGDGYSALQEYEAGTDPTDKESKPQEEGKVSQVRTAPSMSGVKENLDKSIPANHQIRPGVYKYNDPIGDDKGPGYYTYPTNPVYVSGGFDILSFEVDGSGKDNVVFKITVNADLKQDWGMAADFDIQHFQIYIDQDRVSGSGNVLTIPGLNVLVHPDFAWDRVVLITPQPESRVQIEVDVKAKDLADYAVIPTKISGQGRTITAVVKKSALGLAKDENMDGWAWQVVAQSNEGFPDPEDMLTRNVNEYRGLHRIGGGSDYWGDPELVDILVWPAMGSLQEATDQFAILNIWESYPDPKMDIRAVLPMVDNDTERTEQWVPKGGYQVYAKELASKIKPPAQKDKYVSDNFTFAGSVNAQYYYNWDNAAPTVTHPDFAGGGLNSTFVPQSYYDNTINSRFTLEFYGKTFTDLLNFYARISTWWGADSAWDFWQGNYYRENHGPQYVPIQFEAFRFQLVEPIKTVDYVSIGNYDYGISAWTVGAASYPDRDKFKGIFVDGSAETMAIQYNLGLFYPFPWLGANWSLGNYTKKDHVLAGMFKIEPLKALKIKATGFRYFDAEMGVEDAAGITGVMRRMENVGADGQVTLNLSLLNTTFVFDAKGGYASLTKGTNSDGQIYSAEGAGIPDGTFTNIAGFFGVGTVQMNNLIGTPFSIKAQGFIVKDYYSVMAARGDYANAAIQDVLIMYGNQSASAYPQDDAKFQKYDNVMWESVANGGWAGGTAILQYSQGLLKFHAEFSAWTFMNTNWHDLVNYTNGQWVADPNTNDSFTTYTNNTMPYGLRGYGKLAYKLDIGSGIDIELSYLFNQTKNWWPFAATSQIREGMENVYEFTYGFILTSHIPKLTAYYQFTKLFRMGIGFEYRRDNIHDLYPGNPYPDFGVQGYTAIVDLQYNTPLGNLRSYIQAYKADNPRGVPYGNNTTGDFRKPLIYYGNQYNVVALTEMDIHF